MAARVVAEGTGEIGIGGRGGDGLRGGPGGSSIGGFSLGGGNGGIGSGGGIWIDKSATLTIDPRLGAKKGTKQSRASNTITGNQANRGLGGPGGGVAGATVGKGGAPDGPPGRELFLGQAGDAGASGAGIGGGVVRFSSGNVTLANTSIKGNNASTAGDDVSSPAVLE